MTFIDDSSRNVWVYFMKNKSEVFDAFKKWKAVVENETELKVKCFNEKVIYKDKLKAKTESSVLETKKLR